jgi:hypothetical protein
MEAAEQAGGRIKIQAYTLQALDSQKGVALSDHE